MDIDNEIDRCLKKLYEEGYERQYTLFANELYGESFMYDVPDPLDRTMINKGLIERMKDARMLTELGIRISQQGGWKQYLNQRHDEVRKEKESQAEIQALTKQELELSIQQMRVSFKQIKHWFWLWMITIIASALLGGLFQAVFNRYF